MRPISITILNAEGTRPVFFDSSVRRRMSLSWLIGLDWRNYAAIGSITPREAAAIQALLVITPVRRIVKEPALLERLTELDKALSDIIAEDREAVCFSPF